MSFHHVATIPMHYLVGLAGVGYQGVHEVFENARATITSLRSRPHSGR
jgi:hypothetical protein